MKRYRWLIFLLLTPFVICALMRWSMDKDSIVHTDSFPKAVPGSFKNRYPIIIHHGVVPLVTLHKLARDLRAKGYLAYSSQVSAANSYSYRAEELALQIKKVLDGTGAEKVNIIAHSMGGVDARYLISQMGWGDRVASLSTISSPHRGTVAAERLLAFGGYWLPPIAKLFVGLALDGSTPLTIDPDACFTQLTREHMREVFNPRNPDDPHVYYQSWAGVAGPPTDVPVDIIHFWSFAAITAQEGENDGIISVASARWGHFRGTIPSPHSSQVGKPAWLGGDPRFNAFDLFEAIAKGLSELGF